jgi:hypothetical protein
MLVLGHASPAPEPFRTAAWRMLLPFPPEAPGGVCPARKRPFVHLTRTLRPSRFTAARMFP